MLCEFLLDSLNFEDLLGFVVFVVHRDDGRVGPAFILLRHAVGLHLLRLDVDGLLVFLDRLDIQHFLKMVAHRSDFASFNVVFQPFRTQLLFYLFRLVGDHRRLRSFRLQKLFFSLNNIQLFFLLLNRVRVFHPFLVIQLVVL